MRCLLANARIVWVGVVVVGILAGGVGGGRGDAGTDSKSLLRDVARRLERFLEPLQGQCVEQRSGGWWRYRWCHKDEVLQFHTEQHKGGVEAETIVWSAGTLSPGSQGVLKYGAEEDGKGASKNSRSRSPKLNADVSPTQVYLSYQFQNGKQCDETQSGRRSEVRLLCCSSARKNERPYGSHLTARQLGFISSVSEVSTCSYLLTVCSPVICWFSQVVEEVLSEELQTTEYSDEEDVKFGGDKDYKSGVYASSSSSSSSSSSDSRKSIDSRGGTKEKEDKWTIRLDSNDEEESQEEESMKKKSAALSLSKLEREELREKIRGMFHHGWDSYMIHAFPHDEVKPLSCAGEDFDLTAGNMLTLIDSLDMLVVLGNYTEFARSVRLVESRANFDIDKTVSVFETTIRILGGLISAHLFASDAKLGVMPDYQGGLLPIIVDLADRLMPAFNTSTSIPYGTVHLQSGVPPRETTEACTSAAGSLSLEFGMVSVLTNDPKYGLAARNALKSIYDHRSPLGLVGRHIDVQTGRWTEPSAGIGSNIDSLYEYYIKHYILFGDDNAFDMFFDLYRAAILHLRVEKTWYVDVNMFKGNVQRRLFNNLMSFWPGMQTLVGDLEAATKTLNAFMLVWNEFGFTPEDFSIDKWMPLQGGTRRAYPLRPELIESVYYASGATQDESWFVAARDVVNSVYDICMARCGFASIKDIKTERLHDNMPSFFLAEFLKYMFLMFDEESFLREDQGGNYVFTTEAHPFPVTSKYQQAAERMGFALPSKQSHDAVPDDDPKEARSLWGCPSVQQEMAQDRTCPALFLPTWDEEDPYIETYYGADPELRTPRRSGFNRGAGRRASPLSEADPAAESKTAAETINEMISAIRNKIKQASSDTDKQPGLDSLEGAGWNLGNGAFAFESTNGKAKIVARYADRGLVLTNTENQNDHVTVSDLGNDIFTIEHTELGRYGYIDTGHYDGGGSNGGGDDSEITRSFTCVLRYKASESESEDQAARERQECLVATPDGSEENCAANPLLLERMVSVDCTLSEFGPLPLLTARDVSGKVVAATTMHGCTEASYPRDIVKGNIVIVHRGVCMFEEKALLAEKAGATALIVIQNEEAQPLFYMVKQERAALQSDEKSSKIAAYMVSTREGATILQRTKEAQDLEVGITLVVNTRQYPYATFDKGKQSIRLSASETWGADMRLVSTQKGDQWSIRVLHSSEMDMDDDQQAARP